MGDEDRGDKRDDRPAWLQARIISSLKCKEEKAVAFFTAEENKAALYAFLDDSECRRLMVFDAGKGLVGVRLLPDGRVLFQP